jgi:spore coat polysaccharide biosynthesis protein SpsF
MTSVLYAIQARSGSKRLPGKSLALIEDAVLIDHVIGAAKLSASYFNARKTNFDINVNVALLIPTNDPIKDEMSGCCFIFEGPEDNVLERFKIASRQLMPDYVVRITGDCPLIIPTIISKHVLSAIENGLDYCSNSFDDMRTFPDGYDCEVMSKKMMEWLFENAKSREEKEHVTILAKTNPPVWGKYGVILGHNDFSHIKISVDTKEELDLVRANKQAMSEKLVRAKNRNYRIFRF